jgi:hypothetical protein
MFEFDESKIPEVRFRESWKLNNGGKYEIYEADDWQFEYFEDKNVDDVELTKRVIYSHIAWLNWLEKKNDG